MQARIQRGCCCCYHRGCIPSLAACRRPQFMPLALLAFFLEASSEFQYCVSRGCQRCTQSSLLSRHHYFFLFFKFQLRRGSTGSLCAQSFRLAPRNVLLNIAACCPTRRSRQPSLIGDRNLTAVLLFLNFLFVAPPSKFNMPSTSCHCFGKLESRCEGRLKSNKKQVFRIQLVRNVFPVGCLMVSSFSVFF